MNVQPLGIHIMQRIKTRSGLSSPFAQVPHTSRVVTLFALAFSFVPLYLFFLSVISIISFQACTSRAWAKEAAHVENFNSATASLPRGWKTLNGHFRIEDGALETASSQRLSIITFGDPNWQNYEIEVTASFLEVDNPSRWLALIFRANDNGRTPRSQVTLRYQCNQSNGTEFAVFTQAVPSSKPRWDVRKKARVEKNWQLNQPRKLRVRVVGSRVELFLDDQFVLNSPLCIDRETGGLGLATSGATVRFDDFRVRILPDTAKLSERKPLPCDIVAHRGFSSVAPENTLSAIRAAIEAGSTGCEFDVYRSKNGTVVLMHDQTVNRTTDGEGDVTKLTLDELSKLDAGSWKGAKYRGEPVPTLAQALAELKGSGCIPVIEIKMEGISQKVVDAVRKADMINEAAVIAFSKTVVKEIRAIEPKLPCAWLCGKNLPGNASEQAAWIIGQAAECGTQMVDLNYGMLSAEIVAALHRQGMQVWCWTVNNPKVLDVLMRWHVDSITTDSPDRLTPLVDKALKATPKN